MFVTRGSRAGLLFCAVAAVLLLAAPAYAMREMVHAKPHKVMTGTTITLRGMAFPANTRIQILECGKTSWLAPSMPCLEDNAVEVTTDSKGRFETPFEVGVCPEGEQVHMRSEVRCYVGRVVFGEDTGELLGAARLLVSYP